MEGEDTLKDDDIGTVHGNCLGFSSVCNKIVNRNINFLHLFQPLKSFSQELKVKSLRGIKVILIDRGCLVLPLIEDLVEAVHGEEGDPGHVQLGDDLVGHRGLAAGGASADPDDKWLHLLALAVIPGGPALGVNGPLGRPDDGLPLGADRGVGGQRPLSLAPDPG